MKFATEMNLALKSKALKAKVKVTWEILSFCERHLAATASARPTPSAITSRRAYCGLPALLEQTTYPFN